MKQSRNQSLTKNILKAVAIIAAIIALLLGIVYMVKTIDDVEDNKKPKAEISQKETASTLYSPNNNDFAIDDKTGTRYVNNMVIVIFESGVSENQINDVAESIGGSIVGSMPEINQYQVKVKATGLKELQKMCEKLEKSEIVNFATCDYEDEYD